ncbi:uncharacterized protein LOC124694880 [Lolium rigidum]|uniref:uncharacterized protein LOC124694880 n=1 Tax=Lolium rigidum TaxID=89674 RepID=UPI001F5C2C38|nr:uncharacterized protein LOC124694880 [Lolium rigidum]
MAKIGCFCALLGGSRKKSKDAKKVPYGKRANGHDWQKVKPVESMDGTDAGPPVVCKGGSVDGAPARDTKVAAAETAAEVARGGRDGDKAPTARVLPDVGLVVGTGSAAADSSGCSSDGGDKDANSAAAPDEVIMPHALDRELPNTPLRLQRSCSNIETARSGWKALDDTLAPAKSRSHEDLVALPAGSLLASPDANGEAGGASPASSVRTTCSADRVMLRRRSSSQVLPSRSRKLWWSLFLWSHRNLHRAAMSSSPRPPTDTNDNDDGRRSHQRHDGYTSDTVGSKKSSKEIVSPAEDEPARAILSQWVAFSAEASSSLDRVSAWVSSSLIHAEDDEDGIVEVGESSGTTKWHAQAVPARRRSSPANEAAVQAASSVVQTLNAFSTVAHVSGMGLKVVPVISAFSSLRAVNLSGNLIAHIAAGSLPRGLHALDLSRNNIGSIEGLRELTRLRVLSLSYNRISRIGHGLSSCTAIRELYLAGNKISDVEGLHRLLKLAVLDVSFNRITTAKGLGQLVANYNSLRALNILGNPVQANVGEETLRKAVSGLLPRLEYLNKQAVKPLRASEAAKDSVAKAALGNSRWSSRRRASSRRSSLSPGSSSKRAGSSSRSRSKSSSSRVQSSSVTRR